MREDVYEEYVVEGETLDIVSENDLMTTRVLCDDCAKETLIRLGADIADGETDLIVKTKDAPRVSA